MPTTVSTSDIARAAQVSQRSVQLHLARTKTRPEGEKWRFDFADGAALVNEIQSARKRNRKNVFTRGANENDASLALSKSGGAA